MVIEGGEKALQGESLSIMEGTFLYQHTTGLTDMKKIMYNHLIYHLHHTPPASK